VARSDVYDPNLWTGTHTSSVRLVARSDVYDPNLWTRTHASSVRLVARSDVYDPNHSDIHPHSENGKLYPKLNGLNKR
jgi:hypothetical protein